MSISGCLLNINSQSAQPAGPLATYAVRCEQPRAMTELISLQTFLPKARFT